MSSLRSMMRTSRSAAPSPPLSTSSSSSPKRHHNDLEDVDGEAVSPSPKRSFSQDQLALFPPTLSGRSGLSASSTNVSPLRLEFSQCSLGSPPSKSLQSSLDSIRPLQPNSPFFTKNMATIHTERQNQMLIQPFYYRDYPPEDTDGDSLRPITIIGQEFSIQLLDNIVGRNLKLPKYNPCRSMANSMQIISPHGSGTLTAVKQWCKTNRVNMLLYYVFFESSIPNLYSSLIEEALAADPCILVVHRTSQRSMPEYKQKALELLYLAYFHERERNGRREYPRFWILFIDYHETHLIHPNWNKIRNTAQMPTITRNLQEQVMVVNLYNELVHRDALSSEGVNYVQMEHTLAAYLPTIKACCEMVPVTAPLSHFHDIVCKVLQSHASSHVDMSIPFRPTLPPVEIFSQVMQAMSSEKCLEDNVRNQDVQQHRLQEQVATHHRIAQLMNTTPNGRQ